MRFSRSNVLFPVVFLTGASLLIVEVVATRILSPYFGNTIYTFSSVIGVILAALSLGYYVGGRFSDRHPELYWFYGIIYASGLSVFSLEFLALVFLPIIGYRLSIVTGPLVSALVLFTLPSFLLGTLSPFAITLLKGRRARAGVGTVSGNVFFWSTLGSIFGSLAAGFVLIPRFGVQQISLTVGVLLSTLGMAGLYQAGIDRKILVKLGLVVALLVTLLVSLLGSQTPAKAIYDRDGVYEKITIYDDEQDGKTARFLQQDRSSSGAMFIGSGDLVYDYTKYYVLYRILKPDVHRALALGGGAYSVPKALLQELPEATIDVVEIEPSLFDLAKQFFSVPENPRLKNHIQDGRRFLHDSNEQYDLIFSDVYYSLSSAPAHFTTVEFFSLAKDKLSEGGVFIANFIGSLSRQKPAFLLSEIKTFRTVFPNSYFFAVEAAGSLTPQNVIFVGINGDKNLDFNDPLITKNDQPIIRGLAEQLIDVSRFGLSDYPLFSDNYSPVEFFISTVLKKLQEFPQDRFDGNEALAVVSQQLGFGPRFISSEGHERVQRFLVSEMEVLAHQTALQQWSRVDAEGKKQQLTNIVGRFYPEKKPRIILGTHFDSKRFADLDKNNPQLPVPGANDSASGTAVLVEIARELANSNRVPNLGVDIVFFDGEEGEEDLTKTSWEPLGSSYFAQHLEELYSEGNPELAIVVDMVCDKNLTIYKERSSAANAPKPVDEFWRIARSNYPLFFLDEVKYETRDDHTPLVEAGIPSFLVIDFDYPAFHTSEDTIDKCSTESLEAVGDSLIKYLYSL